jgi:hypothetical protein
MYELLGAALLGVGIVTAAHMLRRSVQALRVFRRLAQLTPDQRRVELRAALDRGDDLTVNLITGVGAITYPPLRALAATVVLLVLLVWFVALVLPTDYSRNRPDTPFQSPNEVVPPPPRR